MGRLAKVVKPLRVGLTESWAWIGRNHEAIKIMFAVVASAYVLVEYLGKVKEQKVEKALEYVVRFSESEIATARKNLSNFWGSKSLEEWRKQLNPQNFQMKVPKMIKEQDLNGEIRVLTGFYKELALCVEGNICSAETTCHFFFNDIQGFRHNYKWHLDELVRWGDKTPVIIDKLVSTACAVQLGAYCDANRTSPYCRGTKTP